jgi:hypothetical protein
VQNVITIPPPLNQVARVLKTLETEREEKKEAERRLKKLQEAIDRATGLIVEQLKFRSESEMDELSIALSHHSVETIEAEIRSLKESCINHFTDEVPSLDPTLPFVHDPLHVFRFNAPICIYPLGHECVQNISLDRNDFFIDRYL